MYFTPNQSILKGLLDMINKVLRSYCMLMVYPVNVGIIYYHLAFVLNLVFVLQVKGR